MRSAGFKCAYLVGALLLTILSVGPTRADEYQWLASGGGVFNDPLNWFNATNPGQTPPQTPNANDTAIFFVDSGNLNSYWVTFSVGAGVNHLVFAEDEVTWDLSSFTFNTNSAVANNNGKFYVRNGNFSANLFDIADGAGSVGRVTVETDGIFGFNSIRVGKEGEGRFNLLFNGKATGSAISLGNLAQSTGHINIGNTAELDVGSLDIGLQSVATSTVNVRDSGKLIAGQIRVSNGDSFTSGRMTVHNSATVTSNSTTVGAGGIGELEIGGSATVDAGFLKVADNNGISTGTGKVTVFSGSLTALTGLVVGENGQGEIQVQSNSVLTTAGGAIIGTEDLSQGLVHIDQGAWNSTGDILVGRLGQASVQLSNGGQWSSGDSTRISVGDLVGTGRVISVAGWRDNSGNILPSSWSLGTQSVVALKNGNPAILVGNGGQIRDPNGNSSINVGVGSSADLDVSGFAVSGNQIRCSEVQIGTLNIGAADTSPGFGDVSVNNGGIITAGTIRLGEGAGSFGLLKIDGEKTFQSIRLPSSVNANNLAVGGTEGQGRVQVLNGAKLFTQGASVGTFQSSGDVNVRHQNSIWIAEGMTTLGGNLSNGTVSIEQGAVMQADILNVSSGGGIRLLDGELRVDLTGQSRLFNGGGSVSGIGTINGVQFVNAGRTAPGSSPGILTVNADFLQTLDGTLETEIFGVGANESDTLVINGDVDLAGVLEIPFRNGYAPLAGDTYDLLTVTGSINGQFDQVDIRNLAHGFEYQASFTGGVFRLTALNNGSFVPEPKYAIVILGLGLFAAIRRRRLSVSTRMTGSR